MVVADTRHFAASSRAVAPFRYSRRISAQLSSESRNQVGGASSLAWAMDAILRLPRTRPDKRGAGAPPLCAGGLARG